MVKIFPTDYTEKTTIAVDDMILFSDSEDGNKLKKAKYSNLKGENGVDGVDGADGTDGASFVPKGEYSAGTAYVLNDVVSYNGSSWIALQNTTGNTPSEGAYWTLNAAKGTDGTGIGDVMGPATNTTNYIPQRDGDDSKTLKNGIPTSTFAPALGADDNYVTDAEKTVIGNTSGTNTGDEPDASTTVKGIVELAINTEVNTGTSDTLAVTPDALAGSTIFGRKGFTVIAVDATTDLTVADGKAYVAIPECMNGMNLVRANAIVNTAGTTNATTIDIYNVTDSHDMLSTAISIASAGTVGTAGTVDTSYDDVATNDVLRIDVTSMSTTAPKGLIIVLEFMLP